MPSSVIRRYAYEPAQRRLDIAFVSGEAYSYFDVPETVAAGLNRARSKGRYFHDHIRDRFDFRRDRTGSLF
jgi:lysyl-tRNA synthetase class 2